MNGKKFSSLALSLVMAASLAVPAFAAEEETAAPYVIPDVDGKLVVLHTNDSHGRDLVKEGKSIGTAGVVQLKKDFEAAGADVLLLSAGDVMQGTPLVNLSKGDTGIQFANLGGYDAMAPGNHEFDWGYENFVHVLDKNEAAFDVICANILLNETGKSAFTEHVIYDVGDRKVGVFGLTTPETATKTKPSNVDMLTFLQGQKLYDCAQAQVNALEAEGCDIIIAVGHMGVDEETAMSANRSVDVCNNVEGIDLFVDGHSHTLMNHGEPIPLVDFPHYKNDSNTLIVSAGCYLEAVGVAIYDDTNKNFTADNCDLIMANQYSKFDKDVNDAIAKVDAEVNKATEKVVAKTEVALNGDRAPGNRTEETNLGDFATDALLWYAQKYLDENTAAAITNGGGIRATIPAGDISLKTMNTVFPFNNTVVTLDLTGQQILETLAAATCVTPTALGAFPQVAGIEFTVNTLKPYEKGEPYNTFFKPANADVRVTNVTIGGEPLDLEKTYTICTNDFLTQGGDTYYTFKDAHASMKDTGIALDVALLEYTNQVLGGTVPADKYAEPAGRITIIKAPDDVDREAWYYPAVAQVLDAKILNGTNLGFEPAGTVTTAQVYQTLYNMEGRPAAAGDKLVAAEGWFKDAMNWAANAGLFTGKTFTQADNVPINRSAVATIIAKYCKMNDTTVETTEAVKAVPDFAAVPQADVEGVTFCYDAKIMVGDQYHNLTPNAQLNRAQWAQVMVNLDNFAAAEKPAA